MWQPLLEWPEWCDGIKLLSGAEALTELRGHFTDLEHYAAGFGRHRERLSGNALERLILRCDELGTLNAERIFDRRILKAVDLLTQNLADPPPLTELSHHCHLSPSRLSHLFTEQVGTSPRAFLEQQRLERAKELLTYTTLPVAKIAEHVGLEPFYFSRRFKRYAALSPRDYRAQRGQGR